MKGTRKKMKIIIRKGKDYLKRIHGERDDLKRDAIEHARVKK